MSASASNTPLPSAAAGKAPIQRIAFRLPDELAEQARYWANNRTMSLNEYVVQALQRQIAYENQDYPLPTLEQARLNQLVAGMTALSTNMSNLEQVVVTGFESLLGLTRGDSYLMDDEEGDLP